MATSYTGHRERGAALLLLMLVVLVASASVLLANVRGDDLKNRQLRLTQQRLSEAKAALLDFALLNPDLNPGQSYTLPCPDLDAGGGLDEGVAHTGICGAQGVSMIGRLPWRTLGVAAPRDAASECLWYVVSGSFKDAGPSTSTMINADTNGQLQLFDLDRGVVVEGGVPDERPVAMVIAAMRPVAGQTRPAQAAGLQCSPGFTLADFLDSDIGSGLSNAAISGAADAIDVFASYGGHDEDHNDRIATISRAEIEDRITARNNFLTGMRALGTAAASCVARYAANNPGGANDKRMPWPASVDLGDYRADVAYQDVDNGMHSGRLPDIVDDSNLATGNAIARVLSDCNPAEVPEWTAAVQSRWQHWKDHFFYAVADSHVPTAAVPTNCSNCLTVNGAGQYAAILMFAGTRLDGQVRNAPPMDADTKRDSANYLESNNAANVPGPGTLVDFASQPASATFNDLLFCIDENLVVSEC